MPVDGDPPPDPGPHKAPVLTDAELDLKKKEVEVHLCMPCHRDAEKDAA